jgi:DNA modification methylase
VTDTRNKRSVWTVTTKGYKGAHFATYPPELIEPCVLAGSKEGDTVLDPFSGSGTTGEVALLHNRNYVGTELNPDYADISVDRISNAVGMLGQVTLERGN